MSRRRVWEDARGLGRVRGPSGEEGPALVSLLLGGVQIWPRRVLWSWSSSWYSEVDGGEVTSRLRARGRAVGAAGGTSPAWKAREADAEAGQCVRGARGSGSRRSPSAGGKRRVDHPAGAACAAAASTWPGPPLEARGSRPGRRPQAGSPAWLPVLTAPTANGGRRVHRPRLGRSHAQGTSGPRSGESSRYSEGFALHGCLSAELRVPKSGRFRAKPSKAQSLVIV